MVNEILRDRQTDGRKGRQTDIILLCIIDKGRESEAGSFLFVCLLLYVRLGYDRYIGYRVARQGYTRDRLDHPRYRPADLGFKCSVDTLWESSGLWSKELVHCI